MITKEIIWADEELILYPQRALFWRRTQTLFITDPHWGKDDTFRRAGIPIPVGGTHEDLERLTDIIAMTAVERLIILGDFFHTQSSRTPHLLAALQQWRATHAALAIILVKGNHDRHAGEPPEELGVLCVEPGYALLPFLCHHEPLAKPEAAPQGYSLAGHLHPVVTLRERGGVQLRLPCFHFGPHQAVLPAFASFSGGYNITPRHGDRVFVLGEAQVTEV